MADQTKAPTKGQDAEKAQERTRRPEPPVQEQAQGLGGEAVALAPILGDSAMELPVERHAALLGDPRFSHPANAVQRARMVSELQRRYGNNYVQEVVTAAQAKLKVDQSRHIYEQESDRVAEHVDGSESATINTLSESRIASGNRQLGVVGEKCVDGKGERREGIPMEKDDGGGGGGGGAAPQAPAKTKKAGVESFEVKWTKNTDAGPTNATLRLDYSAKFKKDDEHDPALAEFRQNVMTKWKFTDGPHKGESGTTAPMHDDNYSRADDTDGNTINDVNFVSNDNPGFATGDISATDELEYEFTAEQKIIDTSQNNKATATRGSHTGTIKGKHPRKYEGVPETLK